MAYLIRFEDQARKELAALDNSVKIKIFKYLKKLEERDDPRTLGNPLTDNFAGYWRYRVGNYRIISKILDKEITILVLAIQKRDVVYRISNKLRDVQPKLPSNYKPPFITRIIA